MITEDYISFEVARLLKEKGFNERTYGVYDSKGGFSTNNPDICWNEKDIPFISAPTHQMVLKWLRESYDIDISIFPTIETDMIVHEDYNYTIYKNKTTVYQNCSIFYEQACEAAIKYCLINLI